MGADVDGIAQPIGILILGGIANTNASDAGIVDGAGLAVVPRRALPRRNTDAHAGHRITHANVTTLLPNRAHDRIGPDATPHNA